MFPRHCRLSQAGSMYRLAHTLAPLFSADADDDDRRSLAVLWAAQQPKWSRAVAPTLAAAYTLVFLGQVIPSFSMAYSGAWHAWPRLPWLLRLRVAHCPQLFDRRACWVLSGDARRCLVLAAGQRASAAGQLHQPRSLLPHGRVPAAGLCRANTAAVALRHPVARPRLSQVKRNARTDLVPMAGLHPHGLPRLTGKGKCWRLWWRFSGRGRRWTCT